jgi:hypothetical protein
MAFPGFGTKAASACPIERALEIAHEANRAATEALLEAASRHVAAAQPPAPAVALSRRIARQ